MTGEERLCGVACSRAVRLVGTALLLATLLTAGCWQAMVVDMVLDSDTEVSVTVSGGEDLDVSALAEQMTSQFGVAAGVKAIRTGAAVLEIIGTYAAVLDSLEWLAGLGLQLLANDAVTEALLEIAFYALK